MHQYVIRNSNFPKNPKEAITQGFENAEKDFLMNYALDKNQEVIDRSGSCALMAFIIGKKYIRYFIKLNYINFVKKYFLFFYFILFSFNSFNNIK